MVDSLLDQYYKTSPAEPVGTLEDDLREERDRSIAFQLAQSPEPEQVAKANVIARREGIPAPLVDGNIQTYESRERAKKNAQLIKDYPAVGRWASDYRNITASADDYDSIAKVAKSISALPTVRRDKEDFLKNSGFFDRIGDLFTRGVYSLDEGAASFRGALQQWSADNPLPWTSKENQDKQQKKAAQAKAMARVYGDVSSTQIAGETTFQDVKNNPFRVGGFVLDQGVASLPGMAEAILALPLYVASQSGSIGRQRAQANNEQDVGIGDVAKAAPFAIASAYLERLGFESIIGAPGKKAITRIGQAAAGEGMTEFLQSGVEYAGGSLGTEQGFDVGTAFEQGLAGAIAGAGMGAGFRATGEVTARSVRPVIDRIGKADTALNEAKALDGLMENAANSKTAKRDPVAFMNLLDEMGKDSGAENVYIPAEALNSYMQMDGYDGSFDSYSDAVAEGIATGGDVVIPLGEAVSKLAGTPAWNALKDDVRLTPGGMSPREAQTFDEAMADVMADLTDKMEVEETTPRDTLLQSVTDKLMNAGFTPSTARKQAELLAQRAATRSARMGQELTGNEYNDLVIQQVLPEGLAQAQKADTLDMTIGVMRKGKAGGSKRGPSLVDFIRSKGGIEDRGGDLKAMGIGPIKGVSRKGQLKLLRDYNPDQASMLGADGQQNSNSPDELALRAWEAGYFPEFTERPSVNDLLEALAESVAGRDRFAQAADAQTEGLRKAAEELRALLENQGIDPDKASAKEIRAAVDAYVAEQARGVGYDQITPEQARELNTPVDLPSDPLFIEAVANTKGAEITPDGLLIDLVRVQKPDQEGAQSIRTGVFYLPKGSPNLRHYKAAGTAYGGSEKFEGETLLRKPLFVKGATGGKAPEAAYDAVKGKGAIKILDREVMSAVTSKAALGREPGLFKENVENFLESHGVERWRAFDIIRNSQKGNTLRYALQEIVIAHTVRDAGYDSVLGYSKGKNGAAISEVFDVREQSYPARGMDSEVHEAYYQSFPDGPRGRIVFPDAGYGQGKTVIEMFQSRDQSTFLHEVGHLWLEELRFDALSEGAPEQLKADWQAVQGWFKANGQPLEDGAISTEAHEIWARGVERYLMEGKSPTPALRKLFQDFKAWLVQVYRSVTKLNSPVTDDIRGVMDRLIATDEEIAQAREEQSLQAAFTEKPATMTEGEWVDYQRITTEAKDTAHDTLLAKVMGQVKRRVTKEYNERRDVIGAEVTEEIDALPEFKAMRQMRASPVDTQWLRDTYGEDAPSLMPKSVPPLYKAGGANADAIAEMSGFKSGDEMIRLLFGVEARRQQLREGGDKRSVRDVMIAQETEKRLTERYGDPFTDGSIEEEALAAVHNEKQGEVLSAELRVLSRSTGDRPTPYRIAKAWAERTVREGIVKDVTSRSAIQRYRRAAQKAGKASTDAILSGDMDEAFRQKQAQMLNNALVSEAQKVADEVDKAQRRLEKIATKRTIKSVDQDYLERAQALMEQVELRPRSQKSIDRQAQFEAWAAEQEANGHDIVVPASFAASLGTTNWSRLTVEQFLGLDAAVDQIIHLGRFKQTLIDNKEARDFDEVVSEAVAQNDGEKRKPPVTGFTGPNYLGRAKQFIVSIDAAMLKMETVFDWLDNGNPNGVYNRIAFQPIVDAQEARRVLLKDKLGKIEAARTAIPKAIRKRWGDRITLEFIDPQTGEPAVMTRDQLVVMALNMGNEGNASKLAGGYGWNESAILDMLNRELTADEWQFVQNVWDIIDEFWPEASALERRVNGVSPEKVEARPVETSAGVLKGGYFPVTYDPTRNLEIEKLKAKEGAGLFDGGYKKPNTRSGSLNERTQVQRPILLSMGVINQHIIEMAHDITHREALMNAYKFLNDRRIVTEARELLNTEIQKQFNPWLDHIAKEWVSNTTGTVALEKAINSLRTNATFVGMAYRASTGIMQVAGLFNSNERIGARHVIGGINSFIRHPIQTTQFVLENSAEVRARTETMDRDIRDAIQRETSKLGFISDVRRFGYAHIGYMDRFVSVVTWMGGYNKAISEGMEAEQAIAFADKAVRQSQGAGAAKDLAAIQRGKGTAGAASKLLTMFYSYMSAFYQRQRTLNRDFGKAIAQRSISDMPELLARTMWLYFFPALAAELLAGRGPEDDEEWGEWAARTIGLAALGPIPIVRDISGGIASGFGYNFSPASGLGRTAVNLWKDGKRIWEGEETKRATRDVIEFAGYLGAPVSGQIGATTQFLVDVAHGDAEPETFGDWWTGLTKGKIED